MWLSMPAARRLNGTDADGMDAAVSTALELQSYIFNILEVLINLGI